MKINRKLFVLWTVPLLFSLIFEMLFSDFRWFNLQNFAENITFLILIWVLLSLFRKSNLKFVLIHLSYAFYVLFLIIETAFFYLFDTYFSASAIFIFLETNPAETEEFLSLYLDFELIAYVLLMFSFIIIFFLKKRSSAIGLNFKIRPTYKIIVIIAIVLSLKITGFIVSSFPFQLLKGSIEYVVEVQKFSDLKLDQNIGSFEGVKFNGDSLPHTFVLVIGESNAKRQMGLYGYQRETTPLLSGRKKSLWLYNDVISSESHTIPSLKEALVYEDSEAQTESSVIQLMNQAGFKTFWLSNQRPVGIYETYLTKLSKASDQYTYTNTTHWGSDTPFDEVLLPHFDEALKDSAPKKFIVVHLLATHANYELRYPGRFNVFKTEPPTQFPSRESFKIINNYHNSMLYVDYIVNSVIEKVEAKNAKSYVLYFSDHGEEVYYDKDFAGHNDSDIPTLSMFEIPFFVWTSSEYDSSYKFDFEPERPYVLSDFIHSLSDLSQIKFSKLDKQKSIFSKQFSPSKREVGRQIDFDVFFKD